MKKKARVRRVTLSRPFSDERGSIADLGRGERIERLVLVSTRKGGRRGNHMHQRGGHYVYLLDGKLRLVSKSGSRTVGITLKGGDLVWVPARVPHLFISETESRALEFSPKDFGPRDSIKLELRLGTRERPRQLGRRRRTR